MIRRELEKRVLALVRERLESAQESAQQPEPGADLVADLGMDSLARAELWVCVEDEFGLRISDVDAEALRCADDIVDFVVKHRSA
ncbi:MAG: phosphopantetheine-binding protein [Gammaproteobacteria bacterium]|jgi:acyl carrier protein|nr:phosphopantetheine-binding protein [Gammaproteobacteria bacterium]